MAKAFALRRSTAQPSTLDTVNVAATSLGNTIAGMQTTSLLPARCVNLFTVFGGNPYLLTLTAVGNIEIHRYTSGAWALVGGPFTPAVGHVITPLCLHVVNNTITALWSDEAGASDGIAATTSTNGTTWPAPVTQLAAIGSSNGGHSVIYRGTIWFATAIGLWCYAPLARFITLGAVAGSYTVGETVTGSVSGTTAVVRSFNSPLLRVDTVAGAGFSAGETVTGSLSGATGTHSSSTRFVNALPDTGNDVGLTGATGPGNLVGTFASWDGRLYFVQPKTAAGAIKIYQLSESWQSAEAVPAPQWTSVSFSGIVDAGFATVSADSGMWSMFVNRNDELCLFYSASGSTKLAKTSSKTFPLTFTDLTNSILPTSIATKTAMGIALFTDDRRRTNILQSFFIRDVSAGNLIIASWDGTSPVAVEGTITGVDFLLPASYAGQEVTFTNLQPTGQITAVAQTFPGRLRVDYTVRCDPARVVDVELEWSIDGDRYSLATKGDEDSGDTDLPASPSGVSYFFNWDAFVDLDGDLNNVLLRIVPRISGV